ncbi:MAG: hypothetical protein KBG83_09410 [Bacteroidetes bacterium]|nr:hypothetical protein [Bacteroidota bacterium]HOV99314.1 hypothetical protein [Bacteroidota bacterium]
MKRVLIVFTAVAILATMASAQDIWSKGKMSVGVGVEGSLPTGDWGDFVNIGFGGLGIFQYSVINDLLITGQVGYTIWTEKSQKDLYGIDVKTSGEAWIVLAGAKYNIKSLTPGFYVMGQLGIYGTTGTVKVPAYSSVPASETSESETKFVVCPGIGYQIGPIDASVKYVINGDVSNVALNVAYIFPL